MELLERAEGRVVTSLEVPADMSRAEAKDLLPSTRWAAWRGLDMSRAPLSYAAVER